MANGLLEEARACGLPYEYALTLLLRHGEMKLAELIGDLQQSQARRLLSEALSTNEEAI